MRDPAEATPTDEATAVGGQAASSVGALSTASVTPRQRALIALQRASGNRAVAAWLGEHGSDEGIPGGFQAGVGLGPTLARDEGKGDAGDAKPDTKADATQPVSLLFSYERVMPDKGRAPPSKTDTAGRFDITLFPDKDPAKSVLYEGVNAAGGASVATPAKPVLEGPGKADGHLSITAPPRITATLGVAAKYKGKDYSAIGKAAEDAEPDASKKGSAGKAAVERAQAEDKKHVDALTAKFAKSKADIDAQLQTKLKTVRKAEETEIEAALRDVANAAFSEFDKEIKVDITLAPEKSPATTMQAKGGYPAVGPEKKTLNAKAEVNVEALVSDFSSDKRVTTKKEDENVFSDERLRKEVHLDKKEKTEQTEDTLRTIVQAQIVKSVADQAIQHDFTKKDFNWRISGGVGGGTSVKIGTELKDVPVSLIIALAAPEVAPLILKLFPSAGTLSLKVDGSGEIKGSLKGAIDSKNHEEHTTYKKHESSMRQEFASSVAHVVSSKVTKNSLQIEGKMEESKFQEWVRRLTSEETVIGNSATTHAFDERVKDSVVKLDVS